MACGLEFTDPSFNISCLGYLVKDSLYIENETKQKQNPGTVSDRVVHTPRAPKSPSRPFIALGSTPNLLDQDPQEWGPGICMFTSS